MTRHRLSDQMKDVLIRLDRNEWDNEPFALGESIGVAIRRHRAAEGVGPGL